MKKPSLPRLEKVQVLPSAFRVRVTVRADLTAVWYAVGFRVTLQAVSPSKSWAGKLPEAGQPMKS